MTGLESRHAALGATFAERGGRRVVDHYGRPERAARAVRNGVGVIEHGYGVAVVEGDDRVEFVDNAVTNHVPSADGEGCYALLLDPQGRVETDLAVAVAGERLLVFAPPDRVGPLVEDWSAKTFIQDVAIRDAGAEFAVFGVHGRTATEKVASVLHGAGAPAPAHRFVRGEVGDAGVAVVATDAPTGEPGYHVVAAADDADRVHDVLLTMGAGAAPFGHRTWTALTVEAGTPVFPEELSGRVPNALGLRIALDFEKGCYVGQEVVSRIENRGHPGSRLVGLLVEAVPDAGADVLAGDAGVGEVTRAVESPTLARPVALAVVDWDLPDGDLAVRVDGDPIAAERTPLPFVEGSSRSGRLPDYGE